MSCPHESRQYSDQKIEQFKQRVDQLKKEHDKFVAKVQRLDPSYRDTIPWQPRGYSRKRSHESHVTSSNPHASGSTTKKLCSPLLEKEQRELPHNTNSCHDIHVGTIKSSQNPLGLEYSSSEDESWKQDNQSSSLSLSLSLSHIELGIAFQTHLHSQSHFSTCPLYISPLPYTAIIHSLERNYWEYA